MFVRLGLFALALATLLMSIIAEAQPLPDPATPSAQESYAGADCLQDVAVIWLHVVKDGKIQKLAFAPQQLAGTPVISVDGYVNGIVLLSTSPLNVSVNGNPMSPIRMNADGYYKLKHYASISGQDFWSTFLPTEDQSRKSERIKGRYSIFPKVPGDALSQASAFQVTLTQKNTSRHLTIYQDASVKLDLGTILPAGCGAPEFYYLGSNPSQFDCTSATFQKRMDALLAGIQSIERITGVDIVDGVHIIDYDGAHNAYSCNDANRIWLYSKVFWQESVQELQVIAQHETMHILSDRLGLSSSSRMRQLFSELMGFGLFSSERFYVVTGGATLPPQSADRIATGTSRLFDFINEVNFIRGMNGGHSQDNVDEFNASFLHTLMYADRLGSLLGAPIKKRDGASVHLTPEAQTELLNDYMRVLKTMVAEIKIEMNEPLAGFFRNGQTSAHHAGLSLPPKMAGPGD